MYHVEAARQAGVSWFIPSQFGFDVREKGTSLAPLADLKIDILEQIKAAGMDWTVINTGAFTDYATSPVFGVDMVNKRVACPISGEATVTWTPMVDVCICTADIIANSRCRNEHVLLAGETLTHERLAQRLEQAMGETITRIIRTKQELDADVLDDDVVRKLSALFMLSFYPPSSASSWAIERSYNFMNGIRMHDTVAIIREALRRDKSQT